MKTPEKNHRCRLATAPPPSHPDLHTKVLNAEYADDEDVEWLWTETPEGRFVSGYQLVPRLTPPMQKKVPPGFYKSDATSTRHRFQR
jgi:hypothetical protein